MQIGRRQKTASVVYDESGVEVETDPLAYALRHVAVAMIGADKVVTFGERAAAVALIDGFMPGAYTEQQLHDDIVDFSGEDVRAALAAIAPRLTPTQRDVVLRVAIELGVASGALVRTEFVVLQLVAKGLGVSGEHLGEVISRLDFSRE